MSTHWYWRRPREAETCRRSVCPCPLCIVTINPPKDTENHRQFLLESLPGENTVLLGGTIMSYLLSLRKPITTKSLCLTWWTKPLFFEEGLFWRTLPTWSLTSVTILFSDMAIRYSDTDMYVQACFNITYIRGWVQHTIVHEIERPVKTWTGRCTSTACVTL